MPLPNEGCQMRATHGDPLSLGPLNLASLHLQLVEAARDRVFVEQVHGEAHLASTHPSWRRNVQERSCCCTLLVDNLTVKNDGQFVELAGNKAAPMPVAIREIEAVLRYEIGLQEEQNRCVRNGKAVEKSVPASKFPSLLFFELSLPPFLRGGDHAVIIAEWVGKWHPPCCSFSRLSVVAKKGSRHRQ